MPVRDRGVNPLKGNTIKVSLIRPPYISDRHSKDLNKDYL